MTSPNALHTLPVAHAATPGGRMQPAELVSAEWVAFTLHWTPNYLRTYRCRHPDELPVAGRGPRGIALFRLEDAARFIANRLTTV